MRFYVVRVLRECTVSSSSAFYAQNLAFEIVQQQSVKVCLHMYNGNVSLRIFSSLLGSRLRNVIAVQIQSS